MKNLIIITLAVLFGSFVNYGTGYAQDKKLEVVSTTADLTPVEMSVKFRNETFYFFVTYMEGKEYGQEKKEWKLLVSKNREILDALQSGSKPASVKFWAVRFTRKGHKKLWRKASRVFNIDRYNLEPYELHEISNTNALD